MLEHTLRLVRAHPEVLDGFPSPGYPQMVTEMGDRFVAHLRGVGTATARDVAWACDELLLSTDRRDLTTLQCAVCGCALLEAFAHDWSLGRGSPSVFTALQAIWPAVRQMSPRAISAVRRIVRFLPGSLPLEEDERAAIIVAEDLLWGIGGREPLLDEARLEDALDLWSDDLDWLLPVIEGCEGLPEPWKERYQRCGAKARQRWAE